MIEMEYGYCILKIRGHVMAEDLFVALAYAVLAIHYLHMAGIL
jgi:hypothetical protein